ncbi:hypothetical protein AB0P21_07700 [Kribbella sp. NPDC056861]|uniref:hypothetical protein n=1 Tax=Kribbella sp. NPDC056861 TaxID=3154857 RepID=UPI0034441D1F
MTEFDCPPQPGTLAQDGLRGRQPGQAGATLSIFRFGGDPRLNSFVDLLARRSGGLVLGSRTASARPSSATT